MAEPQTQCYKFFKIYFPLSSQQLNIPPAFFQHFDGNIPKEAVLRNQTGKLWLVNLEEGERGLTIKNGWQCFASENSLEIGDFLTFKYDGKCLFDVEIFGKNGCKKEAFFSNMTTTHAMDEKEIEEVETCSAAIHTFKQKYSKLAVKRVKNLGLAEASQCKSRRNRGTKLGEGKVLKAARYVTPEGPYSVTSTGTSMRSVMYIPRSLLFCYGIKIGPEMVLLDQNGKEWPVRVSFGKDGHVLITNGWAPFWKENNLQIGDKCVFEFVLGRANLSQKLHVQIIRKQSKHQSQQIGKA
ncbi:hypothetical protein REPUB_Repub10bG0152700 [Reevesia pubescens]